MRAHDGLSRAERVVAAVLAGTWIAAGLVTVCLGVARRSPLTTVLGLAGVGYGALWVRVLRLGRRLRWPWH